MVKQKYDPLNVFKCPQSINKIIWSSI